MTIESGSKRICFLCEVKEATEVHEMKYIGMEFNFCKECYIEAKKAGIIIEA